MNPDVYRPRVFHAFVTFIFLMSASAIYGQNIMAVLQDNEVWGHGWLNEGNVEIRIGEPGDWIFTTNTWADGDGYWMIETHPFEIQPGQSIQAEDENNLGQHAVFYLTVTAIDTEADLVSGTTDPYSEIRVEVHGEDVLRNVSADSNGVWVADFSIPAGEAHQDRAIDLAEGSSGYADRFDPQGHHTHLRWHVPATPNPRFTVIPLNDHLWGHHWPANDTVTIKHGDPAEAIGTAETDEQGDFWFDSHVNIQPGDQVQVECGDILKAHVVTELAVTVVDPDNDTVSGTAAPETWVSVGMHGPNVNRYVQADEHGDWIVDFSEAVGSEPWDAAYDLTAGDDGYAQQLDEGGDATSVRWFVADPILRVVLHYNDVRGQGWPPWADVEVTIGDPADPDYSDTVHADHQGNWTLDVSDEYDYRLQVGDVVTAGDGLYMRTMTVPALEVTDVDPNNNLVFGIAPEGSEIAVRIDDVTLTTTTDEHGEWELDFSGQVNIDDGTEGWLFLEDEHGNETETSWRYATLDIMDLSIITFFIPEENFHIFIFEIEADGLLSARLQAPSEEWYDIVHDWDKWWVLEKPYSSMEALDAEFSRGEYLLELTHYDGILELTLNFSEDIEIPNATPVVISPQWQRSDVDPDNVKIEWESVEDPNFNAVFVWVEDEIFGYGEEEEWYDAFLPIDNGMPTQHTLGALKSNRLYMAAVAFANREENVTDCEEQVEYEVSCVTIGGTEFSTNTDEELFDPIERVFIDRGRWADGDYSFDFDVEFSEPLQIPGETPLFHRLMLWTPEDEFYTLFDATRQPEHGNVVELELYDEDLDALPGSGWHALVVQKDDESAVATWFLFAEPDSEESLSMPEQIPVVTQPQPDTVLANPLTFVWDPVTDEEVDDVKVFHAPQAYALLATNAVEFSPPEDLPVGPQHVGVAFSGGHRDLINTDSIRYDISQYNATRVDFTVGYTLIYEAGAGGRLGGPVEQVVAPGGRAEFVEAFAEDGAVFQQWDDGLTSAGRTDDAIDADATVTAQFISDGGVSIDWYVEHNLMPLAGETWAHLDGKDPHGKGMTLAQEYLADTDPNDPESRFSVEKISGPPFQIWFNPSSPERMYTLIYTDDLTSEEWHDVDDPRFGIGGEADYMDVEASETLRFYRLKVELP